MLRQSFVVALLVAGIALVLLGATWSYWHTPQMLWSPEQAKEYNEAWRALKATATGGVRRGDPNTDPKLAAAQARFDAIDKKLELAKAANSRCGLILVAAGALLIAVSIWLYSSRTPAKPSPA
jgi:hypothetical protein